MQFFKLLPTKNKYITVLMSSGMVLNITVMQGNKLTTTDIIRTSHLILMGIGKLTYCTYFIAFTIFLSYVFQVASNRISCKAP
jgi:hypothetical protein